MSQPVRVRFAPSPTGMLHIGGLRTALYNYLFARHHKGTFILRIEDTDQNRYVEGAEDDIQNSLMWAGIPGDEGPGETGPYRQSERSEIYHTYAQKLIENGHAYYAFDTPEEIEQMRERFKSDANPIPKYDASTRMSMKNSLSLGEAEVKERLDSGVPYVIRLNVPAGETIRFDDLIRGSVSFGSEALDDQVLLKSDGLPTYHLANVVDDHLMGISHVIRGEEWLSSAPKHLLLYRFFGWTPPQMAHLPLIMSPAGGKLSKRNAEELGIPVNVRDYISGGYEPQAVVNFLAFLGWSPGDDREILSLDEMIAEFSLERVSKAGAIFNFDKLKWYNEQYLRSRSDESFLPQLRAEAGAIAVRPIDDEFLLGVIRLMKDRISRADEICAAGRYFFVPPSEFDEKTVAKAWKSPADELVLRYRNLAADADEFGAGELKMLLESLVEQEGIGFGKLMLPLRLALTGTGGGPDLFEAMNLLGRDEVLRRLDDALARLGKAAG